MKKILIFSLSYYPRVSGAEIAVKEITDRISPQDVEFHLVTMRFSTADFVEDQIGNVRVYRVGNGESYLSKILYIPRAALFAARLHKEKKFDALWALMSYMVLPIMLLHMRGVRLPYVLTLQDGDPFEHVFSRPHIRPFGVLLKKGFTEASVVQVISHHLAAWASRMGYTGPVEVIPNGVDHSLFSAEIPPEAIEACKKKIGKKDGDVWLVHTGRLVRKNGLDVVIRALPHMPLNVHFLLIGSGVEGRALKDLADEMGMAGRVHFVGAIDNALLPAYLRASDIFVRPSRSEGMGTSFIEAFAAGVPVIATQEGGIADFLFDWKRNPDKPPTGFAVAPDSPTEVAQAVQTILDNPETVRSVVDNARALVAKNYDWDTIAKNMHERVFNRVISGK